MNSPILLPWPPKECSPNWRGHWSPKSKAVAAYRHQCKVLVHWSERDLPPGPIPVRIVFRPPNKRARDMDNMLSSIKGALDGLADGLGVNDKRFDLSLVRGEPHKGGIVEVWLGGAAAVEPATVPFTMPPRLRHSVVAEVAARHGLQVSALYGPFREESACRARDEAIWLIRRDFGDSFARIGLLFDRDHSTVMAASNRHAARIEMERANG